MWQTAVISGITFCSVCFPQANISHVCDDPLPEKYPWSLGSCQNRKELFSVRKFFKLPQIVFSHHPGQDKVLYAPGIRTHLSFLVLLDPCTCRSAFALHLYQSTGASSLKEIKSLQVTLAASVILCWVTLLVFSSVSCSFLSMRLWNAHLLAPEAPGLSQPAMDKTIKQTHHKQKQKQQQQGWQR